MKPLLQVTNQEEKLNAKEEELQKIRDQVVKRDTDMVELEKKFQQVGANIS